ncbi:serine/threonine-protein kinase [Fulvimarina sp. MAC8]|uniref:serine/threonine-protein kinase n=1 Tax=Fulvimarina sp. MAC8 TaxID=3162874 RepID=UPI0032EF5994
MKGPLGTQELAVNGRYAATNWIGAGGMQHVYSARDTLFERRVALKTPKDDAGSKRFRMSAEVSAKINHQNVAKTLDYFDDGDRQYIVEELVEGLDLFEVMSRSLPYLPPSVCAKILHRLAKGLAASHTVGVVHRDLKPSNIMVVGGSLFVDVKITDFGIAKMAENEIGQWAEVGGATSSKTVLGAIPYMSPEAINDFKEPKKSSDVWAIAAIVYELLSGAPPFGTGLKCIPKIVDAKPPKKPTQIAVAQFRALGDELYDIIVSCLEKNPEDRPTANVLVSMCERLCYGDSNYSFGTISSFGAHTGRILDSNGVQLMWHPNSFYGTRSKKIGAKVWFGRDPGQPYERAFPLVLAR